jgi:Spy/CpxP family protein refolding chaperone
MIRRYLPLLMLMTLFLAAIHATAQAGPPQMPPPAMVPAPPQARFQQPAPGAVPNAPMPENPVQVLTRFLQLTEQQVADLRALLEVRKDVVEPLMKQIPEKEKELRDLLNAAGPEPAAVGRVTIAIHDLRRQVEEARKDFAAGFEALLTADQKTRVNAARQAARLQPVVGALRDLGII